MSEQKRSRKEKKKKKKRSESEPSLVISPPRSLGGLKLKISFSTPKPVSQPVTKKAKSAVNSDDEWTEALESGELNENGELPSGPPKVMTARQQSMKRAEESREAQKLKRAREPNYAPLLDKEAEAAQEAKRRAATNRRRMIQEKQRREEKESTMAKLLQKQTSSAIRKDDARKGHRKAKVTGEKSTMRYTNNKTGATLSLPKGHDFPISAAVNSLYPGPRPQCAVDGCTHPRRYVVAKTAQSVCSLQHYKVLVDTTQTIS